MAQKLHEVTVDEYRAGTRGVWRMTVRVIEHRQDGPGPVVCNRDYTGRKSSMLAN